MAHFPNSYALLSGREEARATVVFVHGFAGDANSTWLDFQGMIDDGEEAEYWKHIDLYFYDYQTTSDNILVQASRLRNFLQSIFPRPNIDPFPHPVVASARGLSETVLKLTSGYDSIFLVGHSLGGVIIREMVLELASVFHGQMKAASTRTDVVLDEDLRRLLAATLRLFAPALFGFEPTNLAGFVYNFARELPMLNRFLRVAATSNAVLKELTVGSRRLAELRRRTEEFASREHWPALRANMLFGSKEDTVYMERYDCDPEIRIVESLDHISVCKPSPDYRTPLEFVYGRPSSARV